ncbi:MULTISPECIES: hypothetical protein [unclassified Mycobacterium]|uniref:hypothetical protein n=1 Tax=unclassified Mycobacterium TaxID=2642494 RepID=UPI0029C8038D|nr:MULTISPECIES: hypothetical protein [unclassified Mycobacterium]
MNTLVETAFGADPGRWPLPSAKTAEERWLRAVALGGQGRYAMATAELEALARLQDRGPFPALALSTRASFLRQLGWHSHARTWDGRALARAGVDADARADALIGLAADALGVGRFPLSARLLARARQVVDAGASARLPVRLAWVSAELAMATGDGAAAVGHAERAVDLAGALDSVRHAVKSDVVLAAALCCAGEPDRSRRVADTALDAAEGYGLVPLTWALACLLADVGSGSRGRSQIVAVRDDCAAAVHDRGGVWSNR